MPYIEISEEQLKEFDPEGKLNVFEPEDTTGLKNKANELLAKVKKQEALLAERDAELKKAKLKPDDDEGAKLRALFEDSERQRNELQGQLEKMNADIRRNKIQGEAARIAASLTKDTKRAQLLSKEIGAKLALDGDSFTVLDNNGNPTVSTINDLTASIKNDYPFLVDGSQASGGSLSGGSGEAANAKEVKRSDFDKMGQADRASFAKSGGKVIPD